ncbi:unnamed protein product [Caretta caretta]
METLKRKPDQGKAFELTSKWDASSHFLAGGSFTRFANWWFIHRARLNCVPLNGAIRHGNRDKRCRKCGYSNETLPHVLCSCKPRSRAWQLRHNAIQNRLVKAIAPRLGEVTVNCAIPGTDSQLCPDVVVTDDAQKKIILVDVTVSFGNRTLAFREARAHKLEKYATMADTLRAKGYEWPLLWSRESAIQMVLGVAWITRIAEGAEQPNLLKMRHLLEFLLIPKSRAVVSLELTMTSSAASWLRSTAGPMCDTTDTERPGR